MELWKHKRALVAGLTVVAAAIVAMVPFASAAQSAVNTPAVTRTFTCGLQPSLNPISMAPPTAGGPAHVMALTWYVVNDEDSGYAGYWAMDTYSVLLNAWLLTSGPNAGDYNFTMSFIGNFQVPQGTTSPNSSAATTLTTEPASGYGTLAGGFNGLISGGSLVTTGGTFKNLGEKNYGGTTADILLGTYGNGQTGDSSAFNPFTVYFPGASVSYSWGFQYALGPAFHTYPYGPSASSSTNEWCNWDTNGGSGWGDIIPGA